MSGGAVKAVDTLGGAAVPGLDDCRNASGIIAEWVSSRNVRLDTDISETSMNVGFEDCEIGGEMQSTASELCLN